MKHSNRRFSLGVCIIRIVQDVVIASIAVLIFINVMKLEGAKPVWGWIIFGLLLCLGYIAFDLHFVIKDIRFIKEKRDETEVEKRS
ncbi:hypothetical protein FRZ06_13875 [Anoxybacterium hadale]|uniref:Uncharacterized protein n=1 Tax=Anoxybacterium hadale TaxID=3408580 RepID=A0ACD1AD17_9FIRM|nr:hypothetical protein FRZ06_13875 [Clostridiales bacterium]